MRHNPGTVLPSCKWSVCALLLRGVCSTFSFANDNFVKYVLLSFGQSWIFPRKIQIVVVAFETNASRRLSSSSLVFHSCSQYCWDYSDCKTPQTCYISPLALGNLQWTKPVYPSDYRLNQYKWVCAFCVEGVSWVGGPTVRPIGHICVHTAKGMWSCAAQATSQCDRSVS